MSCLFSGRNPEFFNFTQRKYKGQKKLRISYINFADLKIALTCNKDFFFLRER